MTLKRLAYVLQTFPVLSQTFVVGEIAEVLRRGIELRILSMLEPKAERFHNIVTEQKLMDYTTYDTRNFQSALETFKPDLIHAHFAKQATHEARTLSTTLGIPFTFTAHGYDIYRKAPSDFADRAATAGAIVTVSRANADYISENFGVPSDTIRVIPCGVDTQVFKPHQQTSPVPIIVCVARLKPVKNLRLLLNACAILKKRGVAFRCVLLGEGPCRDELNALKAHLGLEKIVKLLGAAEQTEVLSWWQKATIGVLSSHSEGMPVCLMEAGACGVPVVATAVGGIPDLVEEGVTGLVIPAGDALALAAALEKLLKNRELAAKMGEAARRRIEERFSLVRQVDRLMVFWNQRIKKDSPPCV